MVRVRRLALAALAAAVVAQSAAAQERGGRHVRGPAAMLDQISADRGCPLSSGPLRRSSRRNRYGYMRQYDATQSSHVPSRIELRRVVARPAECDGFKIRNETDAMMRRALRAESRARVVFALLSLGRVPPFPSQTAQPVPLQSLQGPPPPSVSAPSVPVPDRRPLPTPPPPPPAADAPPPVPAVDRPPPPQASATREEKEAAELALASCLFDAVRQYDDRKSDLISVAVGIQPKCHDQFVRYVALYTRGMDLEMRQTTEEKVAPEELSLATSAVLHNRVVAGPPHKPTAEAAAHKP
jgi:hypothetical protein